MPLQSSVADVKKNKDAAASRRLADWRVADMLHGQTTLGMIYLAALERAIEQRNDEQLLHLLDHEAALPSALLPLLAERLRRLKAGDKSGVTSPHVEADRQRIRADFHMECKKGPRAKAVATVTLVHGISEATLERILSPAPRKAQKKAR